MVGYDVAIVGAGILGLSTAYHLKKENPSLSVIVIDRGTAGCGNTSKSVTMARDTFASYTSIALAGSSIAFYRDINTEYDIGLNQMKYLWLFCETQYTQNRKAIETMQKQRIDLSLLSAGDLEEKIVGLRLTPAAVDDEAALLRLPPITHGLLGNNCYSLDPLALVGFYKTGFEDAGGEFSYNNSLKELIVAPVREIDYEGEAIPGQPFSWQKKKIVGVRTQQGEIYADTTILATGAWTREITDKLGIASTVSPKKRQWFFVKGSGLVDLLQLDAFGNQEGTLPFTILPVGGIYIKPAKKEGGFYVAMADTVGREFSLDTEPDSDSFFREGIQRVLAAYFPAFGNVTIETKGAGSYSYQETDNQPVIGWLAPGVMMVGGDSGSGIMKAHAIGEIAAALHNEGYGKKRHRNLKLYGGFSFNTGHLTVKGRKGIKPETFII